MYCSFKDNQLNFQGTQMYSGRVENLFTCLICYEAFDLAQRVPKTLIPCCHTICSTCYEKLKVKKCPLDQKYITQCGVNFLVRDLVENRIKEPLCSIHDQLIGYICTVDKQKVCIKCIDAHMRGDHELVSIETLQIKANITIRVIGKFFDNLNSYKKIIRDIFNAIWRKYYDHLIDYDGEINQVDTQKIHKILAFKALAEIIEEKIDEKFGEKSILYQKYYQQGSKLKNIAFYEEALFDQNFFHQLQEEINQYESKLEPKPFETKIKCILEDYFKSTLGNYEDLVYDISPLERSLDIFPIQRRFGFYMCKPTINLDRFKIESFLSVEYDPDCLRIKNKLQLPLKKEYIVVDKINWRSIKRVELILEQKVSIGDLALLYFIWNGIKTFKLSDLKLELNPGASLNFLSKILDNGPVSFIKVDIKIQEDQREKKEEVDYLVDQILSKMMNIQSLFLEVPIFRPTCINFNYSDPCLQIKVSKQIPMSNRIFHNIDFFEWLSLETVEIVLDENIPKEDLRLFSFVWKGIKDLEPSYLRLSLGPGTISQQLAETLLEGPMCFTQVVIDINEYKKQEEEEIIHLAQEIFSNMTNLKELILQFSSNELSKKVQLALQNEAKGNTINVPLITNRSMI